MKEVHKQSAQWFRRGIAVVTVAVGLGAPAWVIADGYSHDKHHGESVYHGYGSSGHARAAHGMAHMGYDTHHGSTHYGDKTHFFGAHQGANEFIEHILKFKEGMAITEQQEARLKEIESNYKKTRIKMKADVDLANLELHEALKDDHADLNSIEAKLREVHNLKADMYMASIKATRDARGVLTDEQRQRMKAVHDRIEAYGSKMMPRGHGEGYSPHGKGMDKKP